jgi:SAM-dependent methyltransferase
MISQTGFWNIEGEKFDQEHVYDSKLSDALVSLAKKLGITKSYDFGCGPGNYVKNFRKNEIEAFGYDGNPLTSKIPWCSVQDLTSEFQLKPLDFVICLEVCEHVPKEFEDALLKNLDKHVNPNGTLILSWAVVGQGGFGHVNCQNNDYVISKFQYMGYTYNESESQNLRNNVSNAYWFKNTTLVFNKNV